MAGIRSLQDFIAFEHRRKKFSDERYVRFAGDRDHRIGGGRFFLLRNALAVRTRERRGKRIADERFARKQQRCG